MANIRYYVIRKDDNKSETLAVTKDTNKSVSGFIIQSTIDPKAINKNKRYLKQYISDNIRCFDFTLNIDE